MRYVRAVQNAKSDKGPTLASKRKQPQYASFRKPARFRSCQCKYHAVVNDTKSGSGEKQWQQEKKIQIKQQDIVGKVGRLKQNWRDLRSNRV